MTAWAAPCWQQPQHVRQVRGRGCCCCLGGWRLLQSDQVMHQLQEAHALCIPVDLLYRWDLLFHSPGTAGCQKMEVLSTAARVWSAYRIVRARDASDGRPWLLTNAMGLPGLASETPFFNIPTAQQLRSHRRRGRGRGASN